MVGLFLQSYPMETAGLLERASSVSVPTSSTALAGVDCTVDPRRRTATGSDGRSSARCAFSAAASSEPSLAAAGERPGVAAAVARRRRSQGAATRLRLGGFGAVIPRHNSAWDACRRKTGNRPQPGSFCKHAAG